MKKALLLVVTAIGALPALAQEAAQTASHAGGGLGDKAFYALGAGILLGMAALGGTLAQGKIGSSAMDGIARNPQAGKDMFTPMIVALALVESLVVLSWLMAFFFKGLL